MPSELTIIEPPRAGRGFVVVIPGGGYVGLSPSEAVPVCELLAGAGIPCGWLAYPVDPAGHPAPLEIVLRNIAALRSEVTGPIAVLGFSAGGHLASLAATATAEELTALVPGRERARPDLVGLGYPVSTLDRPRFERMRASIVGDQPAGTLAIVPRVTSGMPPTFVWHTAADPSVPASDSVELVAALLDAGVPTEFHLYPFGGHGLSVTRLDEVPRVRDWPAAFLDWLSANDL